MKKDLIMAFGLILVAVISRMIPHAWNFTAVGAVAILAGLFIQNRKIAILTPLLVLLISDLFIQDPNNTMVTVYLGFISMTVISFFIKRVLPAALLGSLSFFLISNFGVWIEGQLYPQNFAGLVHCYQMAIPFLKNEFVSNLIGSLVLSYSIQYFSKKLNQDSLAIQLR